MNYFNEDIKKNECYDKKDAGREKSFDVGGYETFDGCCQNPIYEMPRERVCHRYICYEVPHIMPCNTRVINHHIYRHTFKPEYTCCEENVCENVYGPRCC